MFHGKRFFSRKSTSFGPQHDSQVRVNRDWSSNVIQKPCRKSKHFSVRFVAQESTQELNRWNLPFVARRETQESCNLRPTFEHIEDLPISWPLCVWVLRVLRHGLCWPHGVRFTQPTEYGQPYIWSLNSISHRMLLQIVAWQQQKSEIQYPHLSFNHIHSLSRSSPNSALTVL